MFLLDFLTTAGLMNSGASVSTIGGLLLTAFFTADFFFGGDFLGAVFLAFFWEAFLGAPFLVFLAAAFLTFTGDFLAFLTVFFALVVDYEMD